MKLFAIKLTVVLTVFLKKDKNDEQR